MAAKSPFAFLAGSGENSFNKAPIRRPQIRKDPPSAEIIFPDHVRELATTDRSWNIRNRRQWQEFALQRVEAAFL